MPIGEMCYGRKIKKFRFFPELAWDFCLSPTPPLIPLLTKKRKNIEKTNFYGGEEYGSTILWKGRTRDNYLFLSIVFRHLVQMRILFPSIFFI